MLDSIRSNTQSFGVKVAFGIIILVFVFWGVGSFTEGDMSRVMATVNGESLLEHQFYRLYHRASEQLAQKGISRDQMRAEHLGRQILQTMIAHALVRQEATRLGLSITPLELRQTIQENPLFQNDKGELDADSYKRGLAQMRLSAVDFENQLRDELLYEKTLELIAASVWIDPESPRRHYDFLFEKRVFDTIFFDAKPFAAKESANDEECKSYYEKHQANFVVPKKANVTSITIDPTKLVSEKSIAEEEVRKWYDTHQSSYRVDEAVFCSHILVPLTEKANEEESKKAHATIAEIQKALQKGTSFASLADTYNPQGAAEKGGSLGWIERGKTVEPFEKAAFSQAVGVVSEKPIQTQFGLHLILVHEHRAQGIRPYDEVKGEIRTQLAAEKSRDKTTEVGEALLEDSLLGKDLAQSAKKLGLEAKQSGLLTKEELETTLSLSSEDAEVILSGTPVDTLLQAKDMILVVRVDALEKETVKPFEAVHEEIQTAIRNEKGLTKAMEQAQAMRKTLSDGPIAEENVKQLAITKTEPVERTSPIPPFTLNEALLREAFEAKDQAWLQKAYAVTKEDGTKGALLVHVNSIVKANAEDWDRIHTILERGALRDAAEGIRSIFLQELFKKATITNVNYEKTDRYDG
ncbi:MAG: SurA N-terminal domain-containing protein [Desulfovibrio sp.]|nr:SurA N-terminal domain-containing protein [Desulfovibrio sp.]